MNTITRPGAGWQHIAGSVWDHESGLRLHMLGLVRLPCGKMVSANKWPTSQTAALAIRIAGSRRRGLMVWALWCLNNVGG